MSKEGGAATERAQRAWRRITALMAQQGDATLAGVRPGLDKALIDEAEGISGLSWPLEFKALLALSDGGLRLPGGYRLMGVEAVLLHHSASVRELVDDEANTAEADFFDPNAPLLNVYMHNLLLPVADGGRWNNLYADLSPGPAGRLGQLVELVHGHGMRLKSGGLVDYLDAYAAAIESGSLSHHQETQTWQFAGGVHDVEDLS